MKNLKKNLAAVVAFALAGLVATPISATAANVGTYSADCTVQADERQYYYAGTGDTVTLNLTNCATFEKLDSDYNQVDAGDASASMVLEPGFTYYFYSSNGESYTARVGFIMPATVPEGELLISQDIVMPASPKEFTVGPATVDDEHFLDGLEDCAIQNNGANKHIYVTQRIKVSVAGEYTFRNVGTDPIGGYMTDGSYHPFEDTMLALYSSFNPSRADDNVIGCNDDLNDLFSYDNDKFYEDLGDGITMEGHQPYFTATLTPGYYTIVLTTWSEVTAAQWRAGNVDGDTFTPGSASAAFQMWGPAGGLELAAPEVLANTGGTISVLPIGIASLLMAAGSVFLVTNRMRKQK